MQINEKQAIKSCSTIPSKILISESLSFDTLMAAIALSTVAD